MMNCQVTLVALELQKIIVPILTVNELLILVTSL